ncbi:MAG: transketolase C-terminal domain-containing protein [Caldilineaceae bacterium]
MAIVCYKLKKPDELAESHGIKIEVVDLRSIVPLDMETIYGSVAKTGHLLAVHESQANCGIGAELLRASMRRPPICSSRLAAWVWLRSLFPFQRAGTGSAALERKYRATVLGMLG